MWQRGLQYLVVVFCLFFVTPRLSSRGIAHAVAVLDEMNNNYERLCIAFDIPFPTWTCHSTKLIQTRRVMHHSAFPFIINETITMESKSKGNSSWIKRQSIKVANC